MGNLVVKFKSNPKWYFAASIVASWAGVGSLMNFRTLAMNNGGWSAIIWGFFNSIACIIFGLVVDKIPELRRVIKIRVFFYFFAVMNMFQSWTQMSGIREIFADTAIGITGGTILAYAIAIAFLIALIRRGMIRNVLTDTWSWIAVYALLAVVTVGALVYSHGVFNDVSMAADKAVISAGIKNGLLLLAGPFTNPYFYEIFDYNDKNEDGTARVSNVKMSFVLAGIMFGVYMAFAGLLAWTQFSPALNIVKAILITLIAVSSLSTYLYCEYLTFGKKGGIAVNALIIAGWVVLIPLGVMGIWKLMSSIRWVVVLITIAVALANRANHENHL